MAVRPLENCRAHDMNVMLPSRKVTVVTVQPSCPLLLLSTTVRGAGERPFGSGYCAA